MRNRYITFILFLAGIVAIFLGWALLSAYFIMPYTLQLVDAMTMMAALIFLLKEYPYLREADWFIT